MTDFPSDILAAIRQQFPTPPPAQIGVAVSGGGDSIALLHLLSRCFDPDQVQLHVATVDHGLRPESAREAEQVADFSEKLGYTHSTLRWKRWDGAGNLQDKARRARYALLSDWAKMHKIDAVALGHTADDQAETVLMRLGRAAGVDGLSAMSARRTMHGVCFVRPMLDLTRNQLRSYLRDNDLTWADDPSNEDTRFDRIKARQAMEALAPLGITPLALSTVARNMEQVRTALDWYSFLAARDLVQVVDGDIVLDHRKFRTLPDEIARRLMVQAIIWISGSEYAPRRRAVNGAIQAARDRRSATVLGCRLTYHNGQIWICREYNAVQSHRCDRDDLWDGRWRMNGPELEWCEIRALGRSGMLQVPDWRDSGRPYAALMASPAVWRGTQLVAAPIAGYPQGWHAETAVNSEEFFSAILSH